jgi:GMP synthase-like glutamine amidotransferase
MKPVAIVRHIRIEGPGYLGVFLSEQGIPWQLIRIDAGDPLPHDMQAYSGMVLMGGPMSANDDLPWIPPLLDLIRDADQREIPLLGHCLGGQLISKAFGAAVSRNPVAEIGWGDVQLVPGAEAAAWFGSCAGFEAFHWHGETFALPAGAQLLLGSHYCRHQAYALGKHLALQCHVEMTADMVRSWCLAGADALAVEAGSAAVQSAGEMQRDLTRRIGRLHVVADTIYRHWIEGLRRSTSDDLA